MSQYGLPLVQLAALRPFVSALDERRVDAETLLGRFGLSQALVASPDASVHILVIHQFLETAAQEVANPFFASKVADEMDFSLWPLLSAAGREGTSIGDFLSRFVALGSEANPSAVQYLRLKGTMAEVGENRRFAPPITPAQNDAFMVTLWVRLLEWALGTDFDPSAPLVTVSDPSVLPPKFHVMKVIQGNRLGASVTFPTMWLSKPFELSGIAEGAGDLSLPNSPTIDFLMSFRQVLRSHIFEQRLSVADVAELVSMSRPTLSRRLAAFNTTIQAEIKSIQLERACQALSLTDRTITEIAAELNFSSAANFTRTFRKKFGISPSEYRREFKKATTETTAAVRRLPVASALQGLG